MTSAPIEHCRGRSRAPGTRCRGRRLLIAASAWAVAGCSILFDAPSIEPIAPNQAEQLLREVAKREASSRMEGVRERAQQAAQEAAQEGANALERVIVFPRPLERDGDSEKAWPVMRVAKGEVRHPQLVLESPLRGIIYLDDREIGLLQDGSARVVTLAPGKHRIRIAQSSAPSLVADFYIEEGERIALRWESR